MRCIQLEQLGLVPAFHDHIHSRELEGVSRFDIGHPIASEKTLQRNVKKVEAVTLERINVPLVEHAITAQIDDGNKIRVDCTVMETNIHEPTDLSLLVDSVRVLTRRRQLIKTSAARN